MISKGHRTVGSFYKAQRAQAAADAGALAAAQNLPGSTGAAANAGNNFTFAGIGPVIGGGGGGLLQ